MNKMMFLKTYGGSFKSLTNKVSNGDMSNGTTGWRHYSDWSTESIVSGELKSLRNTSKPYPATTSTWGIASGHKIYVSFKIYGNKSANVRLDLYGTFATTTTVYYDQTITTTPTRYSYVLTPSATANGLTFNAAGFGSSGDYIMIDNVLVIDLTAEFGAGNEPSAATMDAALAYLPGSWFDGTQNIVWTA